MRRINWKDYRNKILNTIDNEAFYVDELKNIDRRGHEIKASCPFTELHADNEDKTPSLTVNLDKGIYICQTCRSKGNVHTMFKLLYGLSSEEAWFKLGDELDIPRPDGTKPTRPEIDVGLVSHYHRALMQLTGPLRDVLRNKRGYTDETLVRFQLGWDGERVTIPIYDEFNVLKNFRRYKWNSTEDQWKVLNYTDEIGNAYGEVRIFGIENLVDDSIEEVIWCEGETDRILAEQYGFPTCGPTSGAGSWNPEWTRYFRNKKRVYILQDNDEAGLVATRKVTDKLYRVTDVMLPQWPDDFPEKGDITDFFVKLGMSKEDFRLMLDNAPKFEVDQKETVADDEAHEVSLVKSSNADLHGRKVKVPVMISGKDGTPYLCPKEVHFYCGDAADVTNKRCKNCDLTLHAGDRLLEMSTQDPNILKLIGVDEGSQLKTLRFIAGIEKNCPICKIEIKSSMNIEQVRMIPKAETGFGFARENDYVVRLGYSVSDNLKTNKRYTMVGHMLPDPRTQYATYLFDKAVPEKDFISEFEMSDDLVEMLKIFQPKPGQSVTEKIDEIHEDLERNVTYVWERRDVGVAVDLVYHTVLNFYFQEQFVKRGWGELLVIGDSGQAKTTLIERIMEHYRLGEIHSGESSKRTGLVYSIQQTNKRWFLVWGAFPLNDGGLVTLDELSGLPEDDLARMSDVRSSGLAKATGVITAETNSRTRAIYISNPRNGRPLNTETFGVQSVLKLFGKTEDVRRLDMAMAVASGDVDPSLVNRKLNRMQPVPHRYTSDLCNLRVMWAWSRRPDDIKFSEEVTEYILEHATEMGKKYTSAIPIVEAADQRIKIARLSIACACMLFSTSDGHDVVVTKDHVDFVVTFMHKVYSKKSFGYDKLSEKDKVNSDASDDKLQKLREDFIITNVHDHNELAKILHDLPYFSRFTLEDYTGYDRDTLRGVVKFLTNNHLVEKLSRDYRRFPLGTAFFESVLAKPITSDEKAKVRKERYVDAGV